jgi:hypothetical protein
MLRIAPQDEAVGLGRRRFTLAGAEALASGLRRRSGPGSWFASSSFVAAAVFVSGSSDPLKASEGLAPFSIADAFGVVRPTSGRRA